MSNLNCLSLRTVLARLPVLPSDTSPGTTPWESWAWEALPQSQVRGPAGACWDVLGAVDGSRWLWLSAAGSESHTGEGPRECRKDGFSHRSAGAEGMSVAAWQGQHWARGVRSGRRQTREPRSSTRTLESGGQGQRMRNARQQSLGRSWSESSP